MGSFPQRPCELAAFSDRSINQFIVLAHFDNTIQCLLRQFFLESPKPLRILSFQLPFRLNEVRKLLYLSSLARNQVFLLSPIWRSPSGFEER
jgi:hypothetical protein